MLLLASWPFRTPREWAVGPPVPRCSRRAPVAERFGLRRTHGVCDPDWASFGGLCLFCEWLDIPSSISVAVHKCWSATRLPSSTCMTRSLLLHQIVDWNARKVSSSDHSHSGNNDDLGMCTEPERPLQGPAVVFSLGKTEHSDYIPKVELISYGKEVLVQETGNVLHCGRIW